MIQSNDPYRFDDAHDPNAAEPYDLTLEEAEVEVPVAAPHGGVLAPPPELVPVPQAVQPALPRGVIYRINSSHASFGELWRDCRSPSVLLLWATKLLRIRVPGSVNDLNVESLAPFETSPQELPADVQQKMAPILSEMADNGFDAGQAVAHVIVDLFNSCRTYVMTLPRADGRAIGRVRVRMEGTRTPPRTSVSCDVLSELSDGRYIWFTSAKSTCDAPIGVEVHNHRGASFAELWALHERHLRENTNRSINVIRDAAGARALAERHQVKLRDFHLRRKLFTPVDEAERQQMNARMAGFGQSGSGGVEYPLVLAEIHRLQTRKSSRTVGVLMLLVSLGLFLMIGFGGNTTTAQKEMNSWQTLLLLVPILFFHELGHYLAMLLFRYRNVRMFFIPMFGAAVNGQNYTAPGWKKVIVAMAGPLPGIVVGGVLACVGIVLHHALLMKAAMLTLLINGFNLLPVLPLDGGRIVQVLLFSRHYGLDLAFRIVTVVILAALGFLPGGRIFFYMAIAMGISIPSAIRTGKIAQELRTQGVGPRPGDDQTIPLDVAEKIISRLKAGVTSRLSQQTKTLAQQTLSVYEGICARPPGWASTIGFGVFYIGGILLSLALTLVLVVAQPGRLHEFATAAAAQPKQKISPADIVMFPNAAPVSTAAHQTVMANFPRPGDAITAYDALRPQLTDGESIERFGQTLMVSLAGTSDDERHQWIDRLQARANEFCVEGSQAPVSIRLSCMAPSLAAAKDIQKELDEYFNLMYIMRVTPPWMPDDTRTPEQRVAQRVARQTYQRLTEAGSTAYKDPQVRELSKKIRQATQYGDTAKVEQLSKESGALVEHLRQRDIDQIRAIHDGSVDQEVVRQYLALPKPKFDEEGDEISTPNTKAQYHAMALRMGEAPEGDDRYLARFGGVRRQEMLLTFSYLSFHDTPLGAPALVNWLAEKGCKSMHYEIRIRSLEIPDVQGSPDVLDR